MQKSWSRAENSWITTINYVDSPGIDKQAGLLADALSAYSQEEMAAIEDRLSNCRKRFIAEGAGEARKICLCSVLTDVKNGNGEVMPDIDNWADIYDRLGCDAA